MILKKDGVFFCDAWIYHICQEMDDREKSSERILFDDLKSRWQFINRGYEVNINFCPFCGKELRNIDPKLSDNDEESKCAGTCPEERIDDAQELMECAIKCMYCAQDVTVRFDREEDECTSEECGHCQAKIKFDAPV
jgi:hypothetical protein